MEMLPFLPFFSLMAFLLYESYMCVHQVYPTAERRHGKMEEHNHFSKSASLKSLLNLNIKFSEFVVIWSCSRMAITCLPRSYPSWKMGNSFTLPWEEVGNSTGHWKVIQEFKSSQSIAWIFLSQINSAFVFLCYSVFSPSRFTQTYTRMPPHTHLCISLNLLLIEEGKKTMRRFTVFWGEADSS